MTPFAWCSSVVNIDELLGHAAHDWCAVCHCLDVISLVFVHDAIDRADNASSSGAKHFQKLEIADRMKKRLLSERKEPIKKKI